MMNGAATSGKRKRPILLGLIAVLLALTLTPWGGERVIAEQGAQAERPTETTSYRAVVVRNDGVEIPFHLIVQGTEARGGWPTVVFNMGERIQPRERWDGARVTLEFERHNSRIEAVRNEDGHLAGSWTIERDGMLETMPFHAKPLEHESQYFSPESTQWAYRCGIWPPEIWALEFDHKGAATIDVYYEGRFTEHGHVIGGTVHTETERLWLTGFRTGGGRPLEGGVKWWLSYFDGDSAMLFVSHVDETGEHMEGELFSGAEHREKLKATRLHELGNMPLPHELGRFVDHEVAKPEPGNNVVKDPGAPAGIHGLHSPSGWYRVGLRRSQFFDVIPFTIFLPDQKIMHDAAPVIRSGGKPIPLFGEFFSGGVRITFPHYDAALTLRSGHDTADFLIGRYTRTGADGSEIEMQAVAVRVQRLTTDIMAPLYSAATLPDDAAPVSERAETWRFDFQKGGPARGLFTIARYEPENAPPIHTVRGTIMTPTGDYRFLSGDIDTTADPPRFSLSTFDGAHAFHFDARMDSDLAHMEGRFLSGPSYQDFFTARRLEDGEDVELPDPFSDVSLKPGESRLHLPQLEDPKYAGKAVIVNIMGTWCPNCHDEAPLLANLHRRYNDDGLEILSLAFEFGLDREGGEDRAMRQIERFRERHRAQWDIVLAGSSDKQQAARALPALSAVKAYPTTIFLDRDHTVRAIHSGFAGPATGERHEEVKREFERLVQELLERK